MAASQWYGCVDRATVGSQRLAFGITLRDRVDLVWSGWRAATVAVPIDQEGLIGIGLARAALFAEAGFGDVETHTEKHTFVLPSFDAYYGPFERGGGSTGQALAALPNEIRRAVREEVRRYFGDRGGSIESEAEYRIASGRR